MISIEEVEKEIQSMGYITVTPRVINPSFYKLSDGTIIRVIAHINYLTPDPKSEQGFGVNSLNNVSAFVPKEKRNPTLYKPYNPSELQTEIKDPDMEPITLKEDFSVYDLSNGLVMSVKSVVSEISKTAFYTPEGEPVYIVNNVPIVKIKKNKWVDGR